MEFVFEVILQFFGEIILQAIVELLVELGLHRLANGARKPWHPALATFGFLLFGAIAGAISLWIFPDALVADARLQLLNLAVTPVVVGLIMMLVGHLRDNKGQELVKLDRFGYAFVFAFSMALIRYLWAA